MSKFLLSLVVEVEHLDAAAAVRKLNAQLQRQQALRLFVLAVAVQRRVILRLLLFGPGRHHIESARVQRRVILLLSHQILHSPLLHFLDVVTCDFLRL